MAYNKALAQRIHHLVAGEQGLSEKNMFGGVAYMLDGNMCCGVLGEELILRLEVERAESALQEPGVEPFNPAGRPMRGWVTVNIDSLGSEATLQGWVKAAVAFTRSLPPK